MGEIRLGDIYSHGGDVKIFIDDDGNVEVETPEDIEDPGELSSETDNINQAADQGLKINISGDQTANFSLFDYGSSKLTPEAEDELDVEDDKIIDYLINGQDYSETIIGQSSNTGPNSNDDNSTGEKDKLDINRANAVANYVFDDIERGLDDRGVKYTSSGTTITLEDGTTYTQKVEAGQSTDSLTQIDKTDNTPTQSGIRAGEVETTEPPTNVVLVDFDPVAAPGTTGAKPFIPPPPPLFPKLIREGQISVIMGLIKPEVELFPYLNAIRNDEDSNKVIGNYEQSDWLQVRDNSSIPEESRRLAAAVITSRQNPDTFISRISKCLGIELLKRAKAKQLQPGAAATPQFVRITEHIHPLYEILGEASKLDEFIDCNNVNKNGGQILSYIGQMYAAAKNPYELGIADTSNLPSELQSQLDNLGFTPSSVGRDKGIYVFLDTDKEQPQPKRDNKKIFSTKENEQFPVGIKWTQFFKDAINDGWSFVSRKNLPKGTSFKTLPSLDLDDIKKLDYKELKEKGKLK